MLFTIIFIILSIVIFIFTIQQKYTYSLFLIILLGLGCRIEVSLNINLHSWDERYHALVAKNLINDPLNPVLYKNPVIEYDYRNWSKNHIWLHKLPVPLWLMASAIKTIGNIAFACRIPSIIISTISILFIYRLSLKIFLEKKIALYSGFLYAVNGLIIELTGGIVATDHIDIAFSGFILFACFFSFHFIDTNRRFHLIFFSFFVALAILSKWLPAMIVYPVFILYGSHKGYSMFRLFSYSIISLSIVLSLVAPWLIYMYMNFPEEFLWEMNYNKLHLISSLTGKNTDWTFFLNTIRINYGELVYLPIIFLVYKVIKEKNLTLVLLLTWIMVPLIFFSLAKTRMQGYLLMSAPAIFIATAYFVFEISKVEKYKRFMNLLIAIIFLLAIRYSFERIKPFEKEAVFVLTKYQLEKNYNYNKTIFYNCSDAIEVMFFTNCHAAYEESFDERTINRLEREGFLVKNLE